MADNTQASSTSNYTMGYGEGVVQSMSQRTAATHAVHLLPHVQPGMRLLDVGCGLGTISVGLAAAVDPGEFYGIDMEPSQVDLATTAAREAGLSNARFQVADALTLPFPDNHFDAVHCNAFPMRLPDTMAALAEMRRVLKPGGIVGARESIVDSIFIEPDIGNLKGVYPMLAAVMTAKGGHPQMGKELPTRLSEAGFVDIWCDGAFEAWSSPSGISNFVPIMLNSLINPTVADSAIALEIATSEEFDGWREAIMTWKDHPGAFTAQVWGVAIGRKP